MDIICFSKLHISFPCPLRRTRNNSQLQLTPTNGLKLWNLNIISHNKDTGLFKTMVVIIHVSEGEKAGRARKQLKEKNINMKYSGGPK